MILSSYALWPRASFQYQPHQVGLIACLSALENEIRLDMMAQSYSLHPQADCISRAETRFGSFLWPLERNWFGFSLNDSASCFSPRAVIFEQWHWSCNDSAYGCRIRDRDAHLNTNANYILKLQLDKTNTFKHLIRSVEKLISEGYFCSNR